jgi:hypothetical protein
MDKTWKTVLSLSGGGVSIGGVYYFLKLSLNTEPSDDATLISILIFTFIVTCIFSFSFLGSKLKMENEKNDTYQLRFLDILLGHKKVLDDYYSVRKSLVDTKLNLRTLQDMQTRNEEWEKKNSTFEEQLNQKNEQLNEQIRKGLHITLPLNNPYPIEEAFINELPMYIEYVTNFKVQLTKLTDHHINRFQIDSSLNRSINKTDFVLGYYLAICQYIINHLFNANNSRAVRSHIRVLKDDYYHTVAAWMGDIAYTNSMTPIPKNEGMIFRSNQCRKSLVKSLNPQFHHPSTNDPTWIDYITIPISSLFMNDCQYLSIGISVRNREIYRKFLYFLSFIGIELVFEENITRLSTVCDITCI